MTARKVITALALVLAAGTAGGCSWVQLGPACHIVAGHAQVCTGGDKHPRVTP